LNLKFLRNLEIKNPKKASVYFIFLVKTEFQN
jgi:hypothetical protein